MSERSREKIALVVFALLVLFAGSCLVGYIVAGHSWNVAATNIDDTFGSLDGYTVIAYAGTNSEDESSSASSGKDEGFVGALKNASTAKRTDEDSLTTQTPDDDAADSAASEASSDGAADTSASKGSSESLADSKDAKNAEARSTETLDQDRAASLVKKVRSISKSAKREWVCVSQVQQSYVEKGATVFVLDTKNPGKYSEGLILKKDDHRFGVFSVEEPTTLLNLKRQVASFEDSDVDFIVAIVSDKSLLKDVQGIDIVISTTGDGLFSMGETKSGTFYVNAPAIGKVGATLISPNNVVSAKVL